jgi:hypothetical protein
MQKPISIRNLAIVGITILTIWMVFSEGILPAVLFAGLFFFGGSLIEVFQRRDKLERGRLIWFTVLYSLCISLSLAFLIWHFRELLFLP